MQKKKSNFWIKWNYLFRETCYRFTEGLRHPEFIFYIFGILIGVGGLGIWLYVYEKIINEGTSIDRLELSKAISTFFIAVIATASADLVLSKEDKDTKIFRVPAICSLIFGAFLLLFSHSKEDTIAFWASIIGAFFSLFLWWIANSVDSKYATEYDKAPSPESSLGGRPTIDEEQGSQLEEEGIKY